MKLLNWNLAWAGGSGDRARFLKNRIKRLQPDVAILTEATMPFLSSLGGHIAYPTANYGYDAPITRKKVAIWSRYAIDSIDDIGSPALPSGRYLTARVGGIRLHALCIPWRAAHVSTGQKNRQPWEEHMRYLAGLETLIDARTPNTVIAGDFNQRYPRARQPRYAFNAMDNCFGQFLWSTGSFVKGSGKQSIDHVVVSPDLAVSNVRSTSNFHKTKQLSDHFGIVCEIVTPD